jgi:hypothetical protein
MRESADVEMLYRWCLPLGTTLVGGAAGLAREVSAAVLLRGRSVSLRRWSGGELVLVPAAVAADPEPVATLVDLMERLAALGSAAVLIEGAFPPGVGAAADRLRLPVFRLPSREGIKSLIWELNQRLRRGPRPDPDPEGLAGAPARSGDRGDLVRALLAGTPRALARAESLAPELGIDLDAPRAVLAAAGEPGRLAAAAGHLGDGALAAMERGALALVVPAPATDVAALKALAAYWRQTLASLGGRPVAVGVGNAPAGLADYPRSWREALAALRLGALRAGSDALTHFDDLAVWRFLLASPERAELYRFQEEVLGDLTEYDDRHRGGLIPTLEAYFASGRSLADAAARLGAHRNTVTYRLGRIRAITGACLDDPEADLALHLALQVRRALAATAPPATFTGVAAVPRQSPAPPERTASGERTSRAWSLETAG